MALRTPDGVRTMTRLGCMIYCRIADAAGEICPPPLRPRPRTRTGFTSTVAAPSVTCAAGPRTLLEKEWLKHTDWDRFIDRVLRANGWEDQP